MSTTVQTDDAAELGTEDASTDITSDSNTKPRPQKKSAGARIWRSAMMLIRRVHLYSGIFMFPFVLLYGFSGWFFNHPGYFRDGDSTGFAAADVAAGALAELPSADEVAESVVEEMNLESFMVDGPEIVLTDFQTPRFTGFMSYTVNTDEATHTISINPNSGAGEVKTVPVVPVDGEATKPEPNPLAVIRSAGLPTNPLDIGRDVIPKVLADLDLSSGEAFNGRRSPGVVFSVNANEVPCLVTYNLGSGAVSSIRQDARPEMSLKDQMRRMHLARMYSPQYDTRWVWALGRRRNVRVNGLLGYFWPIHVVAGQANADSWRRCTRR